MNFHPPGDGEDIDHDVNPVDLPDAPAPEVAAQQRAHLRRILVCFVAIVVLLPFAGIGGAWGWLLLPVLVLAGRALREAIRLRQSESRHGAARGR
jgi:hypothetical protein